MEIKLEIKADSYSISYDQDTKTITCQGSLRLPELEDYEPIIRFFDEIVQTTPPTLKLNLEGLKFLNSTGIAMLSDFVLNVRQQKQIQLLIVGSSQISWQNRSLRNLQKLMPSMKLEYI